MAVMDERAPLVFTEILDLGTIPHDPRQTAVNQITVI